MVIEELHVFHWCTDKELRMKSNSNLNIWQLLWIILLVIVIGLIETQKISQ